MPGTNVIILDNLPDGPKMSVSCKYPGLVLSFARNPGPGQERARHKKFSDTFLLFVLVGI